MTGMSNGNEKNVSGVGLDASKQLRRNMMYELLMSVPMFVFILVYFIQSFGYPKEAARLPRLVCTVSFVLFFIYFVQLMRCPEKQAARVSENPNPKKFWGTFISVWFFPIIWALAGYRIAVLVVSEAMLLLLGVKNRLVLVIVPVVLSLGVYFVFTRY